MQCARERSNSADCYLVATLKYGEVGTLICVTAVVPQKISRVRAMFLLAFSIALASLWLTRVHFRSERDAERGEKYFNQYFEYVDRC